MAIVFAMTGAWATRGGIASANLNVLHALSELAAERNRALTVLSFLEAEDARPPFLPREAVFRAFNGRKAAFARALLGWTVKRSLLCFDHVTLALPVLPFARMGLTSTVIFAHGSEAARRLRRSSRWSFRSARLCIANSALTLKRMRAVMGRFTGLACPLGLSPLLPLAAKPMEMGAPLTLTAADGVARMLGERVLLLVGRMDPAEREKGHRELLALLPKLKGVASTVQLVFAGPGEDRQCLQELAIRTGVGSCTFLPGTVSMGMLQALYGRCYAFVMPSRQEGFGLAYLEA